MNRGIDISKNFGIKSSQEIRSICRPLYELLEITYFNYVKLFPDGSRSVLTDRTDFIIQYYSNPELYTTSAVLNMENLNKDAIFLSCEFREQLSYKIARNDFDIDNGLTIIQPVNGSLELYYFGTKKENYSHVETYKNNIDLFYRFIVFFKEKAKDLIKLSDNDRFFLPGLGNKKIINNIDSNISFIRKSFLEATKPNKIFTKDLNDSLVSLTYREAEILYFLSRFRTSKMIAKNLKISHRTVETHILTIKEKLGYNKKKNLIEHVYDSILGNELNYIFMNN